MRKTITFVLLAAASAAPLAAQMSPPRPDDGNQDRRERGEERGREQRGERGAQRPAPASPVQQQVQQQRAPIQPQRGQIEPQRGPVERQPQIAQDPRRGGDWQGRPNGRPERRDGNRGPGGWQNERGVQVQRGSDYRQDGRDDRRGPGVPGGPGGPGGQYGQGGRGEFRGGEYRGNDRRDWRGGRDDRGGRWSNDWRSDRRYDWQDYRQRNRGVYHMPRYYAPRGYSYTYRRWSPGYRLDPFFYGSGYWINDPWQYRLPPAEGPYRWIRYYNDVILVDVRTGEIVDVIYSFFW